MIRWRDGTLVIGSALVPNVTETTAGLIRANVADALDTFERNTILAALNRAADIAKKYAIKCAKAVAVPNATVTLPYGKACGARDVEGLIREVI